MADPVLELEDVGKSFGALKAVDGVSMSVEGGSRWAVIGPNGAGKTTLFRLISGEHSLSAGSIQLFGRDVDGVPEHRRVRMGVCRTFQITNLFQDLTVEENVTIAAQAMSPRRFAFWRRSTLPSELRDRADRALELIDLADRRKRVVKELSHGEQRQLEIAVGLAQAPKLLLLDEPAAGLSASERVVMRDLVEGLPKDLSIILIEHDMALALGLVEQVLCMDNGQPIATGTPDEIRENEQVQSVYLKS